MCTIAVAKALERPDNSKPNSSHMIIDWVPIKGENLRMGDCTKPSDAARCRQISVGEIIDPRLYEKHNRSSCIVISEPHF